MAGINQELVRRLHELQDLAALDEGSRQSFRVRAYEGAARAVEDLPRDVAAYSAAELADVDGIGKSTAKKIREFVDTGTIAKLEELRERYPPELVELTRIPGLGPKTVILLRDSLGVTDVASLREALAARRVRELPGMGEKSEEKIAAAVERLGMHGKDRRTPIAGALPVARDLVAMIDDVPAVQRVDYAGSLRRFRETIGDIDLIAASDDAGAVMEAFAALSMVREVISSGPTKSSVLTTGGLQVDLRVVAPGEWGSAMLYFTGSKAHNIVLRQRAIDRGWILNEYALADAESGAPVAAATEEEIYAALELVPIPAELREDHGEVEAAATGLLPDLVGIGDIRGDLHVHSDWSGDGRSDLEAMLDAARDRGLSYVGLTDHAEGLAINGLSRSEMLEQRALLDGLRERYSPMAILHGAELNIAPDGSVDYDSDFLMQFDWCVASVHSHFDLDPAHQTERIVTAMRNPAVTAIGHLTGRRIGKRPGIELDLEAVFEAAAETGTALEINGNLERLDVPPDVLRRHRESGARFVIDTDAHHVNELGNVRWGVAAARRGWVERSSVVNTLEREEFLAWVAALRSRA